MANRQRAVFGSGVRRHDAIFEAAGQAWNVDPDLLRAIAQQESGGDPDALSSAKALGVMQIMPETAKDLGVTDRRDPEQSIYGGAKYMRQLLDRYKGDVTSAVGAYNTGPGNMDAYRAGRRKLHPETAGFIPAVGSHYNRFAAAYARGELPAEAVTPVSSRKSSEPLSDDDFLNQVSEKPATSAPRGQTPMAPAKAETPMEAPRKSSEPLSDEDFLKQVGPGEPGPKSTSEKPVPPASAQPTPSVKQPGDGLDYAGWDTATPSVKANKSQEAYRTIRGALSAAPNTSYGEVIPYARDETTGATRPAMPNMLRSAVQGIADLAYGPRMGAVTPEATGALAGTMLGVARSPAYIPGRFSMFPGAGGTAEDAASAARTGINTPASRKFNAAQYDVNDTYVAPWNQRPEPTLRNPLSSVVDPPMARVEPSIARAPVDTPAGVPPGAEKPISVRLREAIERADEGVAQQPGFIPPMRVIDPLTGQVTPVRNPLASGSVPRGNPLSSAEPVPPEAPSFVPPSPGASAAVAQAAREAAETAAIPESLPPAPRMIPVTHGQAINQAGNLINHFYSGNPVKNPGKLVPGYEPRLSGLTNDPGLATLERGIEAAHQGGLAVRAQSNTRAIRKAVDNIVPKEGEVESLMAARRMELDPLREQLLSRPGTRVDIVPIQKEIDQLMAGPAGKESGPRNVLKAIRENLVNADGQLETRPDMVWGIRRDIDRMLTPKTQAEQTQLGSDARAAKRVLERVREKITGQIEDVVPGFKEWNYKWAERSREIEAKEFLEGLKLVGTDDAAKLGFVDRAIAQIEVAQRNANRHGVKGKSAAFVSPEELDALKTLQNTMRIENLHATAGKPVNAATFQYLATNSRFGQMAGNPLVHLGASLLGAATHGPIGLAAGVGTAATSHYLIPRAEHMVRTSVEKFLLNHGGKGVTTLKPKNPPANPLSP